MKKFAAVIAVVVLAAFAAPALAVTNPFMDVPMNHWAYDAIGQLAAHGILSGYPDGTYKGRQPTTRYEMASALARALAVVDMTKASKQDVETMRRLIIEFKDELDALGVQVDELEGKVSKLDSRLGGWKLSGELHVDVANWRGTQDGTDQENNVWLSRARLHIDRWFGEDESMHFRATLRGDHGRGNANNNQQWKQFYVEMPFFLDTKLTVGRWGFDGEGDYYLGGSWALPEVGEAGLDAVLSDFDRDGLKLQKQFGIGQVTAFVSYNDGPNDGAYFYMDNTGHHSFTATNNRTDGMETKAWDLGLFGNFQFNEKFGFDLGLQGYFGDHDQSQTTATLSTITGSPYPIEFKSAWTIFGGLKFNFTEDIALRGIFYHQRMKTNVWLQDGNGNWGWRDSLSADSANHWKVLLAIKQNALKFTSLYAEYGQVDEYFFAPQGLGAWFFFADESFNSSWNAGRGAMLPDKMKYWRVALGQEWTEKWATHEFYNEYKFDNLDTKMSEWGLGIRYKYNPNVSFGLQYLTVHYDMADTDDDHQIRLRTRVTF